MQGFDYGQTRNEDYEKIIAYIDRIKEDTDFKIEILNKKIQQLKSVISGLKGGNE